MARGRADLLSANGRNQQFGLPKTVEKLIVVHAAHCSLNWICRFFSIDLAP